MKIVQIADVHIKNLVYHDVYRDIFSQLYSALEEEKPDYAVICGDIAHTKLNISPEFVEMATNFFKNIADRTKLIIMLGNHDLNLKATSRQDAISPIIQALNHPNITLKKYSGEICFDDVTFNILSPVDKQNWGRPTNPKALNIAVYHGTIGESRVDTGFLLDSEDETNVLFGNDYALLGDIHKKQKILEQGWQEKYVNEADLEKYIQQGWEIINE